MSVPAEARWIPGYARRYRLAPDGRCWSYSRAFPFRLTDQTKTRGFREVELWKDGQRTAYMLHDLVLRVFGPTRRRHQVPVFRDGNRAHCHITNLRWGAPGEQCPARYASPLTAADVRRIFKSRRSAAALAAQYGVLARTIRRIWARARWARTTRRMKRVA